ncbi:MAG: MFS transporter [Rhodobacteraceae bacterium]|nr:MFS transporter [Paracoccaceae bacterium]
MKNYFFILFAAGVIQSVVFGGRQTIPLSIDGINLASTVNYLEISFAFAVGQLISGAVTPLGGAISDKYGSGKTLLLGIIITTIGCFLIPFSNTPLMLVISIGILSAGGSGIAGLPVIMSAVNKLVPPERSGMAFGFVNAGGSIGQFLFAPLAGLMIINYGWQASIFAICALLLAVLPLCWLLRYQPVKKKRLTASDNLSFSRTLSLALSTPSYILLITGFFVCGFHVAFIITHMPGVIIACGLNVNVTGWSLAIIGFFNILGSLFAGWYISKHSMKIFLSYIYGARAIIVTLFLLSPKDVTSIMIFSAALGFTYLSTVPATAALVGKMFGPKYLATLFGITLFSHNIGAFLGAYFGGYFFQLTGEYTIVWIIDIALAIFAAIIHLPIKEKSALPAEALQ